MGSVSNTSALCSDHSFSRWRLDMTQVPAIISRFLQLHEQEGPLHVWGLSTSSNNVYTISSELVNVLFGLSCEWEV